MLPARERTFMAAQCGSNASPLREVAHGKDSENQMTVQETTNRRQKM